MQRWHLLTKEAMEKFCKGEKNNKNLVNDDHEALFDDLETLFEDLRLGKEPNKYVDTYFSPKLTRGEMKLVERKCTNYFQTFRIPNPDVEDAEMKLSESNSKFVKGLGYRKTFTIKNTSLFHSSKSCKLQ